jgi:hypothetical protein
MPPKKAAAAAASAGGGGGGAGSGGKGKGKGGKKKKGDSVTTAAPPLPPPAPEDPVTGARRQALVERAVALRGRVDRELQAAVELRQGVVRFELY